MRAMAAINKLVQCVYDRISILQKNSQNTLHGSALRVWGVLCEFEAYSLSQYKDVVLPEEVFPS